MMLFRRQIPGYGLIEAFGLYDCVLYCRTSYSIQST